MVFVLLAALARIIQDGRILWPPGFTALIVWIFFQAAFIPLSGSIVLSVTFFSLLVFNISGILAVTQLWGLSDSIESVTRLYLWSYILVGFYGILQFLLPLFTGASLPGTAQWLVHGHIARINAFSYEPSYFATYIVIGWIMLVDLRISGAKIASGKRMKWITWAMTGVVLFSSSKTAWLVMAVELLARLAPMVWRVARRALSSLRHGKLLVPAPRRHAGRNVLVGLAMMAVVLFGANKFNLAATSLLSGTGLGGTAAHSYNDRFGATVLTAETFSQSPWLGRSLGGVSVANAASIGHIVNNMSDARQYWGFPVLLDVLAASGTVGFIPFLAFLWSSTFGAFRYAQSRLPDERAKWLRAAARAMIFEWIMLLSDQNLMRVYLWFHFAIVALLYYHLQYGPSLETIATRKQLQGAAAPAFQPNEAPAV